MLNGKITALITRHFFPCRLLLIVHMGIWDEPAGGADVGVAGGYGCTQEDQACTYVHTDTSALSHTHDGLKATKDGK